MTTFRVGAAGMGVPAPRRHWTAMTHPTIESPAPRPRIPTAPSMTPRKGASPCPKARTPFPKSQGERNKKVPIPRVIHPSFLAKEDGRWARSTRKRTKA